MAACRARQEPDTRSNGDVGVAWASLLEEHRELKRYDPTTASDRRSWPANSVEAILVQTTPAAPAAKHATSTVPIIIATAIDPVGAGVAASLARLGGNVTGLSIVQPEIGAKDLSLFKEAVPALK
jgi:hypothetical protein